MHYHKKGKCNSNQLDWNNKKVLSNKLCKLKNNGVLKPHYFFDISQIKNSKKSNIWFEVNSILPTRKPKLTFRFFYFIERRQFTFVRFRE